LPKPLSVRSVRSVVDPKKPLDLAMKLLAVRSRTEQELLRALQRAGVSEAEAKGAVARLRELRYMDDRQVAATRAKSLIDRGEAPRRVLQRLERQGVGRETARTAAEEAREGAGDDELAARALHRKLRGRAPADDREKRRLLGALIAKGHRPGAAARALGIEWDGQDDGEGNFNGD
jgi:regulatory protein